MAKAAQLSSSFLPALARFFAWWSGELAALLPTWLRLWWRGADRIVMLSFDGTRSVFERPAGERREAMFTVDLGTDPALHRVETGRRLAEAGGGKARLLLCLPPEQVLRRTLELPLAVEENLRQTLAFELDRYTPFRPDQAYFDFRIVKRDTTRQRLSVDLAAVPKAAVDQGVTRAAALGFRFDAAGLADDVMQYRSRCLNFLPAGAKRGKSSSRLWWRVGMAAVAALLLAALLAVPIWQKRATAIALIEPVARAKAEAQSTDALRDRLRKLVEEHNFPHDRKWDTHSTLTILDELTKLLPDDTYVSQLDFDGKTVQIQGESASSTTLVETLEASPLFKDVSFKAQLTKIQGTANDRFHIAATLEASAKSKPPAAGAAIGMTDGAASATVALPASATVPAFGTVPASATLPASTLPASATLPAFGTVPASATLPASGTVPAATGGGAKPTPTTAPAPLRPAGKP